MRLLLDLLEIFDGTFGHAPCFFARPEDRGQVPGVFGAWYVEGVRRLRFALAFLAACSSTAEGSLSITTGGETDALTRAPAPTQLVVAGIDPQKASHELARTHLPASSLDLGNQDETTIYRLRVAALDDASTTLLRGLTLPVQLGALEGTTLPVFLQRLGETARMPSPLSDAREAPLATLVIGRFVTLAGGADATRAGASQIYDLATLSPYTNPPALPRVPKTLASLGSRLLLIDDAGATWFELSDGTTTAVDAPGGGTWAEVSGGSAYGTDDGGSFVVGATRAPTGATGPTARVLRIAPDGTLSFAGLSEPRLGAAATFVSGRGLVVAGGSATGAGVEVLAVGATAGSPLPFPADPTTGAAAAGTDATHVLLAGGVGHESDTRLLDLGCSAACGSAPGPALPAPLVRADAVALGGFEGGNADVLVVGDDAAGASHLARVGATAVDVPLKAARRGARLLRAASTESVIVVGGASVLESFIP